MRLVAPQALVSPPLKVGELAALSKLTANWRSLVEDTVFSQSDHADRKCGWCRVLE